MAMTRRNALKAALAAVPGAAVGTAEALDRLARFCGDSTDLDWIPPVCDVLEAARRDVPDD